MNDDEILNRIKALVQEEEDLRGRHEESRLSTEDLRRVEQIEVALDQCWDLLRQRRARREFGEDPDTAKARDPNTVERYVQ